MEESGIDEGFNNVENHFKDLENQTNQTDASLMMMGKTSKNLLTALVGIGITGVAAMTALAVKSPVLAGTMAKIEVETLKLSNTIGRQLRPVFESIAGNLIPAINSAFSKSSDTIGLVMDKVVALVDGISSLIEMDWTSLLSNLEKLFSFGKGDEAETTKIQQKLGKFSEFESTYEAGKDIKKEFGEGDYGMGALKTAGLPIITFIDFIQFLMGTNNEKELAFATANGVSR